ncbi:Hypothetical predicted protein [Podarcis lilfordi]|uniref:Uncharacterized protein n=1 Tax=Podarcis lilfordi TaxID=74358 RepID=A0AA35NZF8_9SAUR|nr:Hypothetical predicted protein [Podarcis lilfordi]
MEDQKQIERFVLIHFLGPVQPIRAEILQGIEQLAAKFSLAYQTGSSRVEHCCVKSKNENRLGLLYLWFIQDSVREPVMGGGGQQRKKLTMSLSTR